MPAVSENAPLVGLPKHDAHHTWGSLVTSNTYRQRIDRKELMVVVTVLNYR
jgi:hypothetical protein